MQLTLFVLSHLYDCAFLVTQTELGSESVRNNMTKGFYRLSLLSNGVDFMQSEYI